MCFEHRVELLGSEREPRMDATIVADADPTEWVQATIVPKTLGDTAEILAFARSQGLDASEEHGLVKISSNVHNMERAFGVKLFEAQTGTERFRSRVPPGTAPAAITIPQELADLVIAVLGLDTRPQAKPHFRVLPTESTGGGQFRAREGEPRYTAGQVAQLYDFPDGDGRGARSRNYRAGRRLPDLRSSGGRHRSIAGQCRKC
jgi:hypothetical protein